MRDLEHLSEQKSGPLGRGDVDQYTRNHSDQQHQQAADAEQAPEQDADNARTLPFDLWRWFLCWLPSGCALWRTEGESIGCQRVMPYVCER